MAAGDTAALEQRIEELTKGVSDLKDTMEKLLDRLERGAEQQARSGGGAAGGMGARSPSRILTDPLGDPTGFVSQKYAGGTGPVSSDQPYQSPKFVEHIANAAQEMSRINTATARNAAQQDKVSKNLAARLKENRQRLDAQSKTRVPEA